MRLTEYQKQEIDNIQRCLRQQIGKGGISIETMAAAMQEQCDNLDYESALSISGRTWQSVEEFDQFCQDRNELLEPDFVGNMLERITAQMDEMQRKGFYLQALDSFEKNETSAEETAGRAALPEEELKVLLEEKMRIFSKSIILEMGDVLKDPCFQMEDGKEESTARLNKEDAFLFAAAEYIAVLKGVLSYEIGESPELLGICAAAQVAMEQFCEGCTQEDSEEYSEIVEGVICAVFGAAFAIGAAVIGLAAASVLETMAFSTLGMLVGILIETTLYMTFICGCIAFIGGLAIAIEAGINKWKDSYQANKQTKNQTAQKMIHKDKEINMEDQAVSALA